MKSMKEMMRAVRDWVDGKIEALAIETLLKKTGDASKVTTKLNYNFDATATLINGEELGVAMAKINLGLEYLYSLSKVALSGWYPDLGGRPIRLAAVHTNYSSSAAYTETIILGDVGFDLNRMWLVVGIGGSESTAGVSGATDFARAYLIVPKVEASSVSTGKGRSYILLQLGSSGSTARYTLAATAATDSDLAYIKLTIPKGSHAHVAVYVLDCANVG